jgi:hypothetical protein
VARYTGLTVVPGDGGLLDGGPVPVQARLVLAPEVVASFPGTLDFRVTLTDGGAGGTVTPGSASGGLYNANWTPPGEGQFLLTAAYPRDGGPSTTVWLRVDTTPPTFDVMVPPADAGVASGGTTYLDPGASPAETFWRRDQAVPVVLRTNEPNLDPGSVTVSLVGTDGGSVVVALEPLTTDCDAGYCARANVELWQPPFNTFRGQMTVQVQASDRAGNAGTSSAPVNVTRWKWRHDIGGNPVAVAAPAVGNMGNVYVGTTNGSNTDGQFRALSPEGSLLWTVAGGAVVASPTIGEGRDGGFERVYVAQKKQTVSHVVFYNSTDGGSVALCSGVTGSSVIVESALSLAQVLAKEQSETVYGLYSGRSGGTLFAARPDVPDTGETEICPDNATSAGNVRLPGTMLAFGDSVVFATDDGRLKSYALDGTTGAWSSTPKWTHALVAVEPATFLQPTSLAASDGRVYGGGNLGGLSKLFSVPLDGGQPPTYFPTSSTMWNVSIGNSDGGTAVVGLETSNKLFAVSLGDGGTRTVDTPSDVIKGAPVWGTGGYVYTAGLTSGSIQARRSLENVIWQFEPAGGAGFEASMNLDCSRSADGSILAGRPGVLYAVDRDGKVYALIVDSPGLDPAAPWPKYQHDSRNTGNPATPILSCQ